MSRCPFLPLLLVTLFPAPVHAQAAGARPPAVDYSAPPPCVDAETFRRRLATLPASPSPTDAAGTVAIRITSAGDVFTGEVRVQHRDGTTSSREVSSARCDEVTDAVEFIAALALGLEHRSQPPPPMPAPAAAPRRPASDSAPPALPQRGASWRFHVGASVGIVAGAGPDAELTPAVSFGILRDTPGWLAPSFELSGAFATSGTLSNSLGTDSLTLGAGALTVCPVRWALGDHVGLRPCVEGQAGVLSSTASGPTVVPASARAEPWLRAALLARAEWRWTRVFGLEAQGGPTVHLERDSFFFTPSGVSVFAVPTFGAMASVGVRVVFP